jgi:hypothetical protein
MFKKEIIKLYKDNEQGENNTLLIDNDQMPIDINKIKKVYSQSKKLMLEIMSFENSEKIRNIEIDPYGYTNSKRKIKDGITYFGYEVQQDAGNFEVDFVMQNCDNNNYYEDAFSGRHFMISFNPDDLNYYIKDMGRGFGTFIKMQE